MNLLCKSIDNMQTFSSRRKVESESESSEHSEPEEITDPKNNPKERQEKNYLADILIWKKNMIMSA